MRKTLDQLEWLAIDFLEEENCVMRPMFGCLAIYLEGLLVLVLAEQGEKNWQGMLIPTSREWQASLIADFPDLSAHPVLGKWLYLPLDTEGFEAVAEKIVRRIRARDPRFGVVPQARSRARSRAGSAKASSKKAKVRIIKKKASRGKKVRNKK